MAVPCLWTHHLLRSALIVVFPHPRDSPVITRDSHHRIVHRRVPHRHLDLLTALVPLVPAIVPQLAPGPALKVLGAHELVPLAEARDDRGEGKEDAGDARVVCEARDGGLYGKEGRVVGVGQPVEQGEAVRTG